MRDHGLTVLHTVVTLASPTPPTSKSRIQPSITDTTPRGALQIMTNTGVPIGFINAEEATAFRTALASSLLLARRTQVKTITVFGAGKQAYWHIRIALLLRGSTIRHIHIINRTFSDRARDLLRSFFSIDEATKQSEGWMNAKFSMLTPSYGEYPRLIKEQVRAADVIFCTVPSTTPLFDHTILTTTEGRRKGRLLVAIGSYKPHMIELPPELLIQAVKLSHGHHFHKHAAEGGVVVVDSLTACLKEAGEIINAGLTPQQLVEIGELVMLQGQQPDLDSGSPVEATAKLSLDLDAREGRPSMASVMRQDSSSSAISSTTNKSQSLSRKSSSSSVFGHHRRSSSTHSSGKSSKASRRKSANTKDDAMTRWLGEGNVIYKSVGFGLMDLVVGGDLVRMAREKGVGVTIQDF